MTDIVIHTDGEVHMELKAALLLYTGSGSVYASSHQVTEVDGKAQIGPGVPLAKGAIQPFLRGMEAAVTYSGYLPANVLYTQPRMLVWWLPPCKRRVWFKCSKEAAADQTADDAGATRLGDRSGDAPHPGLVFAATGNNWFVRAVAGGDRPDPKTPLLVAPYFNVWEQSRICTGNVRLPERFTAEVTSKYEDAFFRSRFTHPNMPGLVRYPAGPYALWADLIDGKFAAFPVEHMTPAKQNLGQWVDGLSRGNK